MKQTSSVVNRISIATSIRAINRCYSSSNNMFTRDAVSITNINYQEKMLTPMSSTSILSKPTGPRELLTMLAIEDAAMTVQERDAL